MNCFEGQFRVLIKEADTENVINDGTEKFNHIILNVEFGDLKTALKRVLKYRVDDLEYSVRVGFVGNKTGPEYHD